MSPTETEERTNPLLDYIPKTIGSWNEWMAAWDAAELTEYKHQLLHMGLDLLHKDSRRAIPFYLRVADGHLSRFIHGPDDPYLSYRWLGDRETKNAAELRAILAGKAFTVLVNKFFAVRPNEARTNVPDWVSSIFLGEILEDVVWFLRCEERTVVLENWGPRNFTSALKRPENERATQVMTDFIVYLTQLAFNHSFFDDVLVRCGWIRDHKTSIQERLVAVRPQLIEPLAYVGRLDLLLEHGVEIDDDWLAELARVAGVEGSTYVADAVMLHRKPAMVLQNLNTIRHGQKVAAAEAEAEAAKARAEELRDSTT